MVSRFIPTTRLERYDVVNKKGEDMGQVQTFIVDMVTGRITLAVVAFGGFLGLTDKWVAFPFERLAWRPRDNKFLLNVPRQAVENAKGINKDTWPKRVTAKWLENVYAKYGCSPYWKGRIGVTYNTGEKAPKTGIYEYLGHVDPRSCKINCQPTDAEREIALSKGETFPPLRSCGKAAIWKLVRAA